EIMMDGRFKQLYPSFEMYLVYRELRMRRKRGAFIGIFVEQNSLPEAIHLFQVFRPAVPDHIIENVCQQVIFTDFAVEVIDEQLYILQGFYVLSFRLHYTKDL